MREEEGEGKGRREGRNRGLSNGGNVAVFADSTTR